MRVEFLLEEPSMGEFLRNILPKILPNEYILDENVFLRPHNGKSDLMKSIKTKIKGFLNFNEEVKFVILHDQDGNDCIKLKNEIISICSQGSFIYEKNKFLIRIVCKELESWYIGDLDSIEKAYPDKFKSDKYKNKKEFREPDKILKPSNSLKKILPEFQKVKGAREISNFIDIENNTSKSFNVFVEGLKKFLK